MRFLKLILICLILSTTLLPMQQSAEAKGISHRIVISHQDWPEDKLVSDTGTVSMLSMTRLEKFWCDENALDLYCGEIEEPTDIADGYLLQRQYQLAVNEFRTFDEVEYYPSTTAGQRGYVFYKGIVNGSSEYDAHWYYVSREAEIVLQRLLEMPTLHDYILVAEQNERFPNLIALIDPDTLERVITIQVDMPAGTYITAASADATGQKLIINVDGAAQGSLEIDYPNWSYCSLGVREWLATSFDKQHHLFLVGNLIEVRAADTYQLLTELKLNGNQVNFFTAGDNRFLYMLDYSKANGALWEIDLQNFAMTKLADVAEAQANWQGVENQDFLNIYFTDGRGLWVWDYFQESWQDLSKMGLESVTETTEYMHPIGFSYGQLFFYHEQARYLPKQSEDGVGGLFQVEPYDGTVQNIWHTDIPFAQVLYNNNSFYGLSNPADAEESTLYRLAGNSETVLAEQSFAPGAHYIDYVQMDASVFGPDLDMSECAVSYDQQILNGDIQ